MYDVIIVNLDDQMDLVYESNTSRLIEFTGGQGQKVNLNAESFERSVHRAHKIIDQISSFDFDIFSVLGMRNLSAFIGELFAASLIKELGSDYGKNPHQDGYPDLLLLDNYGREIFESLKTNGQVREKSPFSPFPNGGIEVKATCGSVPTPDRCRRLGLLEKPDIGDQRIGVMIGYDWKAHHRDTNNLAGILWDFVDRVPRIVAVFFSSRLDVSHWSEIIQPRAGGGRTTSVSIMTRNGVKVMYEDWVTVIKSDKRYTEFLNFYNKSNVLF